RDANTRLASENERLQQQSQSLESLNDSLRAEISRRNEDLLALQDEVNRLRDEVEAQGRALFDPPQEAGRLERGAGYFLRAPPVPDQPPQRGPPGAPGRGEQAA